ncbi:hypothetical protein [Actinoallomurus sp. CA-150999]|uniref:hypothetical protein n=1 Tax=Actinoallomurus sp. CA-150999 TaxID=3239887 RepID=UPI003D8DD3B9
MHISRKITAIAATAVFCGTFAVAHAGTASAASSCWDAHFTRTDPSGHTREAYYCYNVPGTAVYTDWNPKYGVVGYLTTGTNWFLTRCDYGATVGGPHPTRWEYTEADNGNWGWVRDIDIISETNSLPSC